MAEHLRGVVLFVDVAGFTALAEKLAANGATGTESVHAVLNGYFSALIEHVAAAGGEVTTFAGDALAAVFDDRRLGSAVAAARAVECAVGMQETLASARAQPDLVMGPHPHVRIGLGAGALTRALVGAEDGRTLHVVAGEALGRAVAAQSRSRQGEVLADARLVASVRNVRIAAMRGPWCVLRSGVLATGPADEGQLSRPEGLAEVGRPNSLQSQTAAPSFSDEHRLVTSVFVALPDMNLPRDGGHRLQDYLRSALPIIGRYRGDLRQVDAGDKGYQLVIGFGAPRSAADDAERAVGCSLELLRIPAVRGRSGVATGPAFCAELGTRTRREYVVIGDSVNVAARLAQVAAPGELRIDGATAHRCNGFTQQRRLGSLKVKGRSAPVEAFAVEGLREVTATPLSLAPAPGDEFVGRLAELAVAHACEERAYGGHGQVLLLTGDPGVGKSRLVAQLVAHPGGRTGARPHGDAKAGLALPDNRGVVAGGAGGAPGDTRPYLAWRTIWRALLIGADPQPADVRNLASRWGEDERAPLLGTVLGLRMPDTTFTAALTPLQRADATRAILLECLRQCCTRSPVTIVVDDAQWLDELSQDLLVHLAVSIGDLPVLFVVVARDEPGVHPLLARLRSLAPCTTVALTGLPAHEAESLVRAQAAAVVRGREMPSVLVSRIAIRGSGNPFYLEQLVNWAYDHPEALTPEQVEELPPDVQRLVLARVDQLLPGGQAALRAASVIADDFSAATLHACLLPDASRENIECDLRQLESLQLINARPGPVEGIYGFRHALVQEVVYGSLSRSVRSRLHETVGEHLERTHAGNLQAWADRLAHHYGRSRNISKQRIWFRAAGDHAASAYANEAALRYYHALIGFLPETEKPEILVRIGAIHQLTGRWHEAEEALREALETAATAQQGHTAARAQRELGVVLLSTRRHTDAINRLRWAAEACARLGDHEGRAAVLDRLAWAQLEHGDYTAALETAQQQLAVEEPRQDPAGLSAALENNALVRWRCGEYSVAMSLLRRSYVLARRSGDRRLIVHTANDLAGLYAERGDHRRAVRYLQEAIRTAEHIGYRQAIAYLTGNAGELYRDRGHYAEAERHFAAGLLAGADIGDWITTVRCVAALAMTAADQGSPGHEDLLRRACEIASRLHHSYVLADLLLRRAEAVFERGDAEDALAAAQEAEATARRLSDRGPTLRPHLLRLRVEVAAGRTAARHASREINAMLPEWPDAPERALLLETLVRLDPSARSQAAEAASLYRELYQKAPSRQYAAAYHLLTGGLADLPSPPSLPRLAASVPEGQVDLEDLFSRVERLQMSDQTV